MPKATTTAPLPDVRPPTRRPSSVWIIPAVAALLGLWLVVHHYTSQGPLAEVRFETAEGLVAGKTEVRCRAVKVGVLESVTLSDNLDHVVASLRINADSADLLRNDSRFWVVRPRVSGGGISGLGTIVSGAYIQLEPGSASDGYRAFVGLEDPPITPASTPGLHLTLLADNASSLGQGSPITYKGIEVGKIEKLEFEPGASQVAFKSFIRQPYDELVTGVSRFYVNGGINFELDSSGVRLNTGSLESIVAGGVAFYNPPAETAPPASSGDAFALYPNLRATGELVLDLQLTYLLLFDNSVRGLNKGAPVEYRGLRVGTVSAISFDLLPENPESQIPVLVKIDPSRLGSLPSTPGSSTQEALRQAVANGLRASLKTGSLITGALFVDLDFVGDAPAATLTSSGGFQVIPTISTGLADLQDKLAALLDKLNALPLEETIATANQTLAGLRETADAASGTAEELRSASASIGNLLASDDTQALPGDIRQTLATLRDTIGSFDAQSAVYQDISLTLADLRAALRSFEELSSTIGERPNSLIFGRPKKNVTPPRGKR